MSSSRSKSSNKSVTNTSDNRVAADGGAIVTRGDVTVTDGGAIALAGEVSEQAIDFAGGLAFEAVDSTTKALKEIIERDRNEEAKLAQGLVQIGIPALVIAVIAWRVWQ